MRVLLTCIIFFLLSSLACRDPGFSINLAWISTYHYNNSLVIYHALSLYLESIPLLFLCVDSKIQPPLSTRLNCDVSLLPLLFIIIIILAVHATAGRWPPQLAPCTSILGRSHPLTANGFLDVISPSPFGSSS